MNRASPIPPELPVSVIPRHHNILAAAAFSVAFVSTAIHGVAFYMARDLSAMPPHAVEGGAGFSLAAPVWLVTFAGIALGIVGLAFLLASGLTHRHALFSFLHIAALVFLLPTAYAGFSIARLFFQ